MSVQAVTHHALFFVSWPRDTQAYRRMINRHHIAVSTRMRTPWSAGYLHVDVSFSGVISDRTPRTAVIR